MTDKHCACYDADCCSWTLEIAAKVQDASGKSPLAVDPRVVYRGLPPDVAFIATHLTTDLVNGLMSEIRRMLRQACDGDQVTPVEMDVTETALKTKVLAALAAMRDS